jgi:hypothetical protein
VISQCVVQNVFHTNFVVLILPILADLLYLQMFYPHILLLEFKLCRDDGGEADMFDNIRFQLAIWHCRALDHTLNLAAKVGGYYSDAFPSAPTSRRM